MDERIKTPRILETRQICEEGVAVPVPERPVTCKGARNEHEERLGGGGYASETGTSGIDLMPW